MSLDFPQFGQGLWALFDSTKCLRPEYVLPVLYSESGFSTTVTNSLGCVGINQACPFANTLPDGYASYTASQQLSVMVAPMYRAIVAKYGPINSGTRAYQANFLPATLATAKSLSSVLARQGGAVYTENSGLDYQKTGVIKVSDLAHFIARAARAPVVQAAIRDTYALRPSMAPPLDPVYGTDFPRPWTKLDYVLAATGVAGASLAIVAFTKPEWLKF